MTGFDFKTAATLMVAFGTVQTAMGLFETFGKAPVPRRNSWSTVLGGVGLTFIGLADRGRKSWDEPASMLKWVGLLFLMAAVVMIVVRWTRGRTAKRRVQ